VSPSDFDWFQNTFVVLDTLLGLSILAFAAWLALTSAPTATPSGSLEP
jgi:hypothetical protein